MNRKNLSLVSFWQSMLTARILYGKGVVTDEKDAL